MKEQKFEFSAKNTFFTSDTHFGHANIIRLCNRPFKDVEEMNEKLVENWNRVVPEDGTVFHLGDFAFGGSALWNSIIPRLNGQIYLIIGNHDRKNLRQGYMDKFVGGVTTNANPDREEKYLFESLPIPVLWWFIS